MAIDKLSKKYRKLLTLENEFQVFKMIESLDEKTAKEILRKVVVNKLHNEFSRARVRQLENKQSIV